MRLLRRFFSHWQNWLGLLLVLFFVFVSVAAPILSPMDPENPSTTKQVGRAIDYEPLPPSSIAPLGTLSGQISVYHSLVWGTRSALVFGLAVAVFTALIGVLIGAVSAYSGGLLNRILMRITDAFLAFPVIAGVILIQQLATIILNNAGIVYYTGGVGIITPSGGFTELPADLPLFLVIAQKINPVMIAFILFSWMPYARITHTVVQRVKQADFIQAARALGGGHGNLIFRHLLPNSITPAVVLAARDVGGMVLLQATFTFIGLGGDSLWGMLLVKGRDWIIVPGGIFTYWWAFLPATLALILFSIGWNLVGDGLNDALNPRAR